MRGKGRGDRHPGIGRFLGNEDNSSENWFRHLDHAVSVVGPDHVGLGLDHSWDKEEIADFYRSRPDIFPRDKGFVAPSSTIEPERLPALVSIMMDHGYSEEAIRAILGGNHMRIASHWK